MQTLQIYGASDYLIEIDGALCEEFTYQPDESNYLAFSDGTVLRITYTDEGIWRITPTRYGTAKFNDETAIAGDDDNYSDKITLTGEFKWVLYGHGFSIIKDSKEGA